MYWYPFSDEKESIARAQADTHAGTDTADGEKKFIGNLGEIAIKQFLTEYSDPDCWTYRNEEAMKNQQPEYEPVDFKIGRNIAADVKTTRDIRKLDPVSMYRNEEERGVGYARDGYPKVNPDTADVFIFVLISYQRRINPGSEVTGVEDVEDRWDDLPKIRKKRIKERSGNRVAGILGWVPADKFKGEVAENMNTGARGKFTRLGMQNLHHLLLRADALRD